MFIDQGPLGGGPKTDTIRGMIGKPEEMRAKALTAYSDMLRTQLRRLEAKGAPASELRRGRAAIDAIEKTLPRAHEEAAHIDRVRMLQAAEKDQGKHGLAYGLAGAHFLGPLGVGLAGYAQARARPLSTLIHIAEMRQTAANTIGHIQKAAARLVGVKESAVSEHVPGAENARAVNHPPDVTTSEAEKLATEIKTEPVEAAQSRLEQIIAPHSAHAPKVAQAMTIAGMRAVDYLRSVAPQPLTLGYSLQPLLDKPTFLPSQLDDWKDRVNAAHAPLKTLDRWAAGDISPGASETMKAVWPKLMAEFQKSLSVALATKKDPISWAMTKELALLFDHAPDATLTPAFGVAVQEARGAASEQQSRGDGPSKRGAPRQALSQVKSEEPAMTTASEKVALAAH
jgi:hypothetical protein